MMALKRKKAYEGQIDKIMGAKLTLESQVMTIENANVNLEAMNAMKSGADAMKSIHGRVYVFIKSLFVAFFNRYTLIIILFSDIDKVDTTMDDIRDQMDLANEISDAISQPVGFGLDMDEDELQQELDELEQIDLDEKLLDNSALPQTRVKPRVEEEDIGESLPSVPTGEPKVALPPRPSRVQVEEDEDAELSELRASMAM